MTFTSLDIIATIKGIIEQFIYSLVIVPVDQPIDSVLENAVMAEHEIRLLFRTGRQDVQDKYLGLIDIFNIPAAARRTRRSANLAAINPAERHILPVDPSLRRIELTPSTVFDLETFKTHWQIFTHGVLSKMRTQDWNNVIVAGGSISACIMSPWPNLPTRKKLNEHYQSITYASSDIDIFLWGMTPQQAEGKMQDIYKAVCAAAPWEVVCVRRANTITIHTTYPFRPVQIALRLHQSPAEILAGFDIDSSCCAYDGTKVYVNPRALAAIIRQTNTTDMARLSPFYENRLAKYALRGFQIFIPSLDRNRISPWVYNPNLRSFLSGLARLLVLEAALTRPGLYAHLQYPTRCILPHSYNDSDLKSARIPYGPIWDARKVKKEITQKDEWVNSPSNPMNDGHRHIFLVGSMRKCIRPSCQECEGNQDAEDLGRGANGSEVYVGGPVRFITAYLYDQLSTRSLTDFESWAVEAYEDRGAVVLGEDISRIMLARDIGSGSDWNRDNDDSSSDGDPVHVRHHNA